MVALEKCEDDAEARDREAIISSIRYDHLSCEDVSARRDRMAACYGLPSDVKREDMKEAAIPGLSPLILNLRSERRKDLISLSGIFMQ